MLEYQQLHAAILQGQRPARHFVSVAVEAGLADRLSGLLTQLWHAVLTQRALSTVTYGSLPGFDAVCDSPFGVDWTRPPDAAASAAAPAGSSSSSSSSLNLTEELLAPLKYTYKGERGYSGARELPPGMAPEQYQMLYLINRDDKLGIYQRSNLSTLLNPEPAVLLAASNRGRSFALLRNPHHKQRFWDFGVIPTNAFMCGFFFLCSPNAAIERHYGRFWTALQAPGTLRIGIQVRRGDDALLGADKDVPAETILQAGAEWFACAEQLEKAFAVPGQRVVWFINSDSQRLRQAAKAKYGDKVVTDDGLAMTHPDCFQSSPQDKACEQAAMDAAFQHSLGAMLTFSMTDYQVVTVNSGFGKLGAWLSGRWDNMYEVAPGQSCDPSKPMPPEHAAFSWAGI